MNTFVAFLALAAVCSFSSAQANTCTKDTASIFTGIDFQDMTDSCVKQTEDQIRIEITASLKYLAMGAYFAKDSVNRPGFAKLYFDAASEEREHAYKLIEYLSMRGRYLRAAYEKEGESRKKNWKSSLPDFDISKLVTELEDLPTTSGLASLQKALTMETDVTKSIRELVKKCEDDGTKPGFNHYHFVDYLTGEFLEEQYKGQRDLAGKIATLGKMVDGQGADLAEYLFDKQLL